MTNQVDTANLEMNGGQALARALAAHQVGPMFGMGGFQLLPFYAAMSEYGLVHHLINDERVGAFAADAYARIARRPGVCDGTLGPGATNLVTALVESSNAGIPVIAVTGNAHRMFTGRHMTQEADQVEILKPTVKALLRVEHPQRIPEMVRRAYSIATSGRPGPVVLDVPEDVCHAAADFHQRDFWTDPKTIQYPAHRIRPDQSDVEAAAAHLRSARRPVILAGGGVHIADAYSALQAFADMWEAPVAHTISGKGAVACIDEQSIGLFGRYSRTANAVIESADCIVAVGCKLGEVATERYALIPEDVPLIHVDIEPSEFGRTARHAVGVWGDARLALEDLTAALEPPADRGDYLPELTAAKARWRTSSESRLTSSEVPISVARLCHEINQTMPADGILVADGGFAAHWTALLYDTKVAGRGYVADRGFASIGYGVPGALGAGLAAPGRSVVALTGDAGLNMTLGDLETIKRVGVPVTIVVVNNSASGYVKALQHIMYDGNYQSADLTETDYSAVAKAMGLDGIRVEDPAQLRPTLIEAFQETSRPLIVDVAVTRDAAEMLPGVDRRTRAMRADDRIA